MSIPGLIVRSAAVFTGAGIVALIAGAMLAPWPPREVVADLHPEPLLAVSAVPGIPTQRVDVTVARRDGSSAAAWLVLPRDVAPVAAAVLIAGAGASTRDDGLAIAEALAARGVAALTVDKRADGYDPLRRDFDALARDAQDAAELLGKLEVTREVPLVAVGFSEGGWVAPRVVAAAPQAFAALVLVSPPVVTPLAQAAWSIDAHIEAAPEPVRRLAATAMAAGRAFVTYLDDDADAALAAVTVPVLAVWGAADTAAPVASAVVGLRESTAAPVTAIVLAGAGHDPAPEAWTPLFSRWLGDLPSSAKSVVQGVEPATLRAAPELPPAAWYLDARLHAAWAAGVTAIFVVLRLRRPRASKGRRP